MRLPWGDPAFLSPLAHENRTIYNFFYGDLPDIPASKLDGKISALDIAPTLLWCAGARWDSDQFGLGINIFSETQSLLEQYGRDEFDRQLSQPSKLYEGFY